MSREAHTTGKQRLANDIGVTVELCCGQHTLKYSAQLIPFICRALTSRGFPPGVYTVTLRRKTQRIAEGELLMLRDYNPRTRTGIVKIKPPGERIAWNGHLLFPLPEDPKRTHMLLCIAALIVESEKA